MKLDSILGGAGIISGIIGLGGMCGAIENETDFILPTLFLILSGVLIYRYLKEGGTDAQKKSDRNYYGNDASYPSIISRSKRA